MVNKILLLEIAVFIAEDLRLFVRDLIRDLPTTASGFSGGEANMDSCQ